LAALIGAVVISRQDPVVHPAATSAKETVERTGD